MQSGAGALRNCDAPQRDARGLAAGTGTGRQQCSSPNTYNFQLTVLFLLALIMGGRKSRTGAMLGATITVMLPTLLDVIVRFRWEAVLIALAVAVGAVVAVQRGRTRWRRWPFPCWAARRWRCSRSSSKP
jgi:branched-chain amino acid transport system permease protein